MALQVQGVLVQGLLVQGLLEHFLHLGQQQPDFPHQRERDKISVLASSKEPVH